MLRNKDVEMFSLVGVTDFQLLEKEEAKEYAKRIDPPVYPHTSWVWNGVLTEENEYCDYFILDGPTVKIFPEFFDLYVSMVPTLEKLVGEKVYTSAWPRSAINVNYMVDSANKVGLHVDSNPLTLMLFLSTGRPTEFILDNGAKYSMLPDYGRAGIFFGKLLKHRVPPGPGNKGRISLPFCYYTESDFSRADWFDDYVYNNKDYNQLNG